MKSFYNAIREKFRFKRKMNIKEIQGLILFHRSYLKKAEQECGMNMIEPKSLATVAKRCSRAMNDLLKSVEKDKGTIDHDEFIKAKEKIIQLIKLADDLS